MATQTLRIRDADGSWVTLADDLYLDFPYHGWHTLKLVGDLATLDYVRLIVNDTEYDVSAYAAFPWESSDGAHIRPEVLLYSDEGHNGWSHIDDVILTQNEPP